MRQNALCVSAYLKERKRAQAFPHGLCRGRNLRTHVSGGMSHAVTRMVECKIDDGAEAGVFERCCLLRGLRRQLASAAARPLCLCRQRG